MPYRSLTRLVAAAYVVAALATGAWGVRGAIVTFGARGNADGLTRAQFPVSLVVVVVSVAAVVLVVGSGIAVRRQRPAARALWVLGAVAGCGPLLVGSLVAGAWLGWTPLGLVAIVAVTAMAGLVAVRSPAWPASGTVGA